MKTKPLARHSWDIAALVFGALSTAFCYWIYVYPVVGILRFVSVAGVLVSIAAVLNYNPRLHKWRWMGVCGMVLNIIALLIGMFVLVPGRFQWLSR